MLPALPLALNVTAAAAYTFLTAVLAAMLTAAPAYMFPNFPPSPVLTAPLLEYKLAVSVRAPIPIAANAPSSFVTSESA
jgi:hypothetical protein